MGIIIFNLFRTTSIKEEEDKFYFFQNQENNIFTENIWTQIPKNFGDQRNFFAEDAEIFFNFKNERYSFSYEK